MTRSTLRTLLAAVMVLPASLTTKIGAQPVDSATPHRRIQPLPALGSAPETGFQFGATVLAVYEPALVSRTRPTSLLASALRSTEQQTRVSIEGEHWTRGNARKVAASAAWQEFPLPFYGIGDRTPELARETFTPKSIELTASLQQRVREGWYAVGSVRYLDQSIIADTIGVVRQRTLLGSTGGRMTEWSAGFQADTRDNLFAPRAGHWVQVSHARAIDGVLSDFQYGRTRVDARAYRALRGEHVIAAQLQVVGIDGAAPFDQLALVGNSDIMRGYAKGRYRDRWMSAAQGEYRTPIRYRVGAVAFLGAGLSSPSLGEIGKSQLLPTYGAGLRVQIDPRQRTSVRADYGRGRDGASGLYIGFNNAF